MFFRRRAGIDPADVALALRVDLLHGEEVISAEEMALSADSFVDERESFGSRGNSTWLNGASKRALRRALREQDESWRIRIQGTGGPLALRDWRARYYWADEKLIANTNVEAF